MRISILSAAIALSVLAVPALAQQAPTGAVVTANEPGKVAVAETVKASATVSAIDKATRKVSLKAASGKTFEVVASVDGLDVLDGTQASRRNSDYVLKPYSSLNIAGFRKSEAAVASFTFSQPSDAYAANTASGSIKNTGIIGTVIYELKAPVQSDKPKTKYAPAPNAFPAD